MFWSDVESLFDLSLFDDLVDDDSDRSWIDVEDLSSSSVIDLIGHSLVDCSIGFNIYKVSLLESGEVVAHSDCSMTTECLGEL